MLVTNLYAPIGFDDAKITFFNDIFELIGNYDCDIIIGGDFNVTLGANEWHCRGVTQGENEVATLIKDYLALLDLTDTWSNIQGHTWRMGKILSRLDRILTRLGNYDFVDLKTDRSLINSDHAAVIVALKHKTRATN